jgi:hypothetical protein
MTTYIHTPLIDPSGIRVERLSARNGDVGVPNESLWSYIDGTLSDAVSRTTISTTSLYKGRGVRSIFDWILARDRPSQRATFV